MLEASIIINVATVFCGSNSDYVLHDERAKSYCTETCEKLKVSNFYNEGSEVNFILSSPSVCLLEDIMLIVLLSF